MNPFALIGLIFHTLFLGPVINLLVLILHGLDAIHIPGSMGFAIIILTLLIRFLVWPFMATQLKSAKKLAELRPQLDELKRKHQKDKQALAAAQMALYKQAGVNPAGGCLPSIIQIPIIIALYQSILILFDNHAGLSKINEILYPFVPHLGKIPDPHFLGLNLANKPSEFASAGLFLLLVPVITAGLQFLQSKMMAPKKIAPLKQDTALERQDKLETDDAMATMQSQMMFMMPLMIGFFSWQFPIGLAIYWNTFTIMGIIQQHYISGWGGLESWINKLKAIRN